MWPWALLESQPEILTDKLCTQKHAGSVHGVRAVLQVFFHNWEDGPTERFNCINTMNYNAALVNFLVLKIFHD